MTQNVRITESGSVGDLDPEEGALVRCPYTQTYRSSHNRNPKLDDGLVYGWLRSTNPDSDNDLKVYVPDDGWSSRTNTSNYFDADALEVVAPPLKTGITVRGPWGSMYDSYEPHQIDDVHVVDISGCSEPWFRGELNTVGPDSAGDSYIDIGTGSRTDVYRWSLIPETMAVGIVEADTPPRSRCP